MLCRVIDAGRGWQGEQETQRAGLQLPSFQGPTSPGEPCVAPANTAPVTPMCAGGLLVSPGFGGISGMELPGCSSNSVTFNVGLGSQGFSGTGQFPATFRTRVVQQRQIQHMKGEMHLVSWTRASSCRTDAGECPS